MSKFTLNCHTNSPMASIRIKEEPELCIIDDPYISETNQWKYSFEDINDIDRNKENVHDNTTAEDAIHGEKEVCVANSDITTKRPPESASTPKYLINDCAVCYMTFRKLIDYELHMSKVHSIQPYECDKCGIKFSRKADLAQHFRDHTGSENLFTCIRCRASFVRRYHLRTHNCKRQYMRLKFVPPLKRGPRPKRVNSCSVCYKTFKKMPEYELHMAQVHNIKPYECSTCGMKFSRKSYLLPHFRIHTGDKPYSCNKCPVSFSRASDFKKHIRSHQGVRLFKCELCDKRFTRAFSLRYHLGMHTGEQKFVCQKCGIGFRKSTDYNYHEKTNCMNRFECVFCKKAFKSRNGTALHMKRCH